MRAQHHQLRDVAWPTKVTHPKPIFRTVFPFFFRCPVKTYELWRHHVTHVTQPAKMQPTMMFCIIIRLSHPSFLLSFFHSFLGSGQVISENTNGTIILENTILCSMFLFVRCTWAHQMYTKHIVNLHNALFIYDRDWISTGVSRNLKVNSDFPRVDSARQWFF